MPLKHFIKMYTVGFMGHTYAANDFDILLTANNL